MSEHGGENLSHAQPVSREVGAPPSAVWAVLADGWTFSSWVVGTARIRAVDPSWPRPGSRIHHSFGTWPFLLNDQTHVVREEQGRLLELTARGWPAGEARVQIEIRPEGDRCMVRMSEDAVSGPGALIPPVVRQPLIAVRNRETLRRLAMLAEGKAVPGE
jgi:hypothetical protein